MRAPDYRVPDQDGALLAEPRFETWPRMVEDVRRQAAGWEFDLAGTHVSKLRADTRRDALALARDYTELVGRRAGATGPTAARNSAQALPERVDATVPLVVTGHQPTLFHPGVWAKNMLVDRLAGAIGGVALNLAVDSDAAGGVCINYPRLDDERAVVVDYRCLFEGVQDVPFEALSAPSLAEFAEWTGPIALGVAALARPEPTASLSQWLEASRRCLDIHGSLAEFMIAARRAYEEPLRMSYLELVVSRLAGTDAFLLFALDLCDRAQELKSAYNGALKEYRALRQIKNPANPFPDLVGDASAVEMPFWILTGDGRRESLQVVARDDHLVLDCGPCEAVEVPRGDWPAAVAAIRSAGVALRPKAVTLTMFARVLLADFFLHGVGGAKYDAVTDEVIQAMYGIEPPPYAVASMTMHLAVADAPALAADVSRLEHRLSVLKHNPDRVLAEEGSVDQEATGIIAQKRELVAAIAADGADKKTLGAMIRELNDRLQAAVAPLVESTERDLARAKDSARATEIAAYRDFAYPFFAPAKVRGALGAALALQDAPPPQTRGPA